MSNLIRLSKSCLGEEEKLAVMRVLDAEYLGMGQEVMLFERELESFFSNKVYVACVNTGTSALQLALQACGIGDGDEVIIPSITYVASFQATSATGAKPIACDIDLNTGTLEPGAVRKLITPKTKAIMHVHYASGVGERDTLFEIANEFGLRLIEDAAHSFGGYYKEKRIGEEGDVVCFSFDGIKNITCGEGGAVLSSDCAVIEKIKDLRLLGVEKDTEKRYSGNRSWDFNVQEQGWRYHMNNISAAIGREQLKKVDKFGHARRVLCGIYHDFLKKLPVQCLKLEYDRIIPHVFPVLVSKQYRDALRKFLLEKNIESGIHYKPNHLLSKFRNNNCANAEVFGETVLSLPLHCDLKDQDINFIQSTIKNFFELC